MSFERLNQRLTLVANFGVIAGIIFLAVEINQNTEVTRSSTEMDIAYMSVDFFMRIAESPELARVNLMGRENPESLSAVEKEQYQAQIAATFLLMEGAYKQYQLGFLPPKGWAPYEDLIQNILSNPISRDWWVNSSVVFIHEFEAIVTEVSGLKRKEG